MRETPNPIGEWSARIPFPSPNTSKKFHKSRREMMVDRSDRDSIVWFDLVTLMVSEQVEDRDE